MGDLLDVHAAFRRDDEGDAGRSAIDERGEIELLLDVGAILDVEAVDLLARRPRLDRHERRAEHFLGELRDLVDRLGEAHAALFTGGSFLELALAAAAGMDLGLHDPERAAQFLRRRVRVFRLHHGDAARNGNAIFAQDGLGLILMDVHRDTLGNALETVRPRAWL